MANNFRGYLIKAVKTGQIFPLEYINYESWNSTPKQREELKAYRDDNTRNLTRITAEGMKSVFAFETRANLHLEDKIAIQNFFYNGEDGDEGHHQRKIQLEYWNEDSNQYETSYFYRPDIQFPIRKIVGNDIIYGALKFDFVEY